MNELLEVIRLAKYNKVSGTDRVPHEKIKNKLFTNYKEVDIVFIEVWNQ